MRKVAFLALAIARGAGATQATSGEEVHCIGSRAHVLRYDVVGQPNDGTSMEGIEKAALTLQPSPDHAASCLASKVGDHTPSGDKSFCYGVNQDGTCTSAKTDLPLKDGMLDCKDCFVGATADVYYALNYSMTHLHSVEVGLKDMHVRGSVALHTHPSVSKTITGSKVLSTNASHVTLIDKLVGCPVCIKAKITVAAPTTVNWEVDLKGEADITAGAMLDINLGERSIKWDDKQGWTYPKSILTTSVTPNLEISDVRAESDLKLGVDTSLQVNIDDIVWYHVDMKPSFLLKATEKGSLWPVRKAQFCLNGDADLTIAHEADLDDKMFKIKHHWGPHQDWSWSKRGIVNVCKNVGNSANSSMLVV